MSLSGISTAICSVCYYKAISLGSVTKVLPIEKSSILLVLLFAIFYFGENGHLTLKLFGVLLILLGMPFLVAKDAPSELASSETRGDHIEETKPHFYAFAFGAALFASLNTIFSKIGIRGIESNLATFVNTVLESLVLLLWVSLKGKWTKLRGIPREEWLAILLSGLATGGSWISYYYAVKMGPLSAVVPLNKLSVPFTALYSHFVLREHISKQSAAGLSLITAGMLLVAVLS